MKKGILLLSAALTLAFTAALIGQQQSTGPSKRSAAAESNRAIISKLEKIVQIRERQVESYILMFRAGKAEADGPAEIELAEARIRLAQEKGQGDFVIAELKNLIAAHQRRIQRAEPLANDRLPAGALEGLKVGLLEAEIRLLKEQK